MKNRKKINLFFLHIRLDLVEFANQMVLFSKFRVDTAENGPVKVEKVQFSKHHFSRLSANFSILSSFTVRTRRDLPPGSENFPKIYSKMTKKFSEKSEKMRKMQVLKTRMKNPSFKKMLTCSSGEPISSPRGGGYF